MSIVLATDDGCYRYDTADGTLSGPLDEGTAVTQLAVGPEGEVYAATDRGAAQVDSGGVQRLGLLNTEVVSVHRTATGALYAGTRPAHLHRSTDEGETWTRVESFESIPGKVDWTQNHMGPAQVRDIGSHRQAPWRLFVAVETAGVYVSPDGGRTWVSRGRGLDNDLHGIQFRGPESLYATCGRGLYRTDDAGRRWYRLDTHHDRFWYQYFREGLVHDAVYYTSVMDRAAHRFQDSDPGRLLVTTDGGTTFDEQPFPDQDDDYVNAWAADGGTVFGGTVGGRLLRGPGSWEPVAEVDTTIRSLAVVGRTGDG